MSSPHLPVARLLLGFGLGLALFAGLYWSLARGGQAPGLGATLLCAALGLGLALAIAAAAFRKTLALAAAERRALGAEREAAQAAANAGDAQLQHDRAWLEAILRDLSEAVIVADRDHRLLLFNARADELLAPCGPVGLRRDLRLLLEIADADAAFAAAAAGSCAPAQIHLADGRGPFAARLAWVRDPAAASDAYVLTFGADDAATNARKLPPRPAFFDFDAQRLSPSHASLADRPLAALAYCVFDLETTGLDVENDAIVSVGAVRVLGSRVLASENFATLVDPGRPIPPASTAIHGIDDAAVAGAPDAATAIAQLKRFAHDAVLVAHNAAFDLAFVARAAEAGGFVFDNPPFDTLLVARWLFPDLADHSLEGLAGLLGIAIGQRHSALDDALATAAIFAKLVEICRHRGLATYGDLAAASNMALDMRLAAHKLSRAGGL
ncbi:MAG: 3'-5' exonuclease [Telmatospirillum sp.]|nr:3'-5' exonuclease [Telmatospirillum sp.]